MTTEKVIRIECGETSKGEAMWTCKTAKNNTVRVFANQEHLLAAYPEIIGMKKGEVQHWRSFPLEAETFTKGEYVNVANIAPRPAGACFDLPLVPDHALSFAAARRWAQFILREKVNVMTFDVETTGVDPAMDEVISIGVVDCFGRVVLDTLIKPLNWKNLSATNAEEIHHITPDMLLYAPTFPEVYAEIKAQLDGHFWLGYNPTFDVNMLSAACLRHDLPPLMAVGVHDAMGYAAQYIGQWDASAGRYPNMKLVEAAELFGVAIDAHHAVGDALATWQIVQKMAGVGA